MLNWYLTNLYGSRNLWSWLFVLVLGAFLVEHEPCHSRLYIPKYRCSFKQSQDIMETKGSWVLGPFQSWDRGRPCGLPWAALDSCSFEEPLGEPGQKQAASSWVKAQTTGTPGIWGTELSQGGWMPGAQTLCLWNNEFSFDHLLCKSLTMGS